MQLQTFELIKPSYPRAVLALAVLCGVGFFTGVVFQAGIVAPYDKAAHGVFFFALTAILHLVLGGRIVLVVAIAAGLGAASELVQALTPHHHASFGDFYADLVGVCLCTVSNAAVGRARGFRLSPANA